MLSKNNLDFINYIGHHSLLYGKTDTGKTYLTAKFIDFLLTSEKVSPNDISILDFAPALKIIDNVKFGGKIKEFSNLSLRCKNISIEEEILAPRFSAKNKKELYGLLCHNYKITSKSLKLYEQSPTIYLIINDLSIYLHLGNKKYLLRILNDSSTFFGNAYYGYEIKSSFSKLLSLKERMRVDFLIKNIDNPISTSTEFKHN
jgi:hypothetical protein